MNSMEVMDAAEALLKAQAVDGDVRRSAEDQLNKFQELNLENFLFSLGVELEKEENPPESKKLAALILRNTLFGEEERWKSMDMSLKTHIKATLVKALSCDARLIASQVIAEIAFIELPLKQWPDLIGRLSSNIHQRRRLCACIREASFEIIGYICEKVPAGEIDKDDVKMIENALLKGVQYTEENDGVRVAAVKAFYRALGFADMTISDMRRIISETTRTPDLIIRLAAFECLEAISSSHYDKLAPLMESIFNLTAIAVIEAPKPIALQAIGFWISLCEKEVEILEKQKPCFYYIRNGLPSLLPPLLEALNGQGDPYSAEEHSIAPALGDCLGVVAKTVGNHCLHFVLPFVLENLANPNWTQKKKAVYALSFILEGPSRKEVEPAVQMFYKSIRDDNTGTNSLGWTVERMRDNNTGTNFLGWKFERMREFSRFLHM